MTGSPLPSDEAPEVLGIGSGDTQFAILSMSARSETGEDAEYLEWHLLDHLPEQYRIPGIRLGQRWVSTPRCRAVRAAGVGGFAEVDHIVEYVFGEPVAESVERFFALGKALHDAGRMPRSVPRRHLGGYDVVGRRAGSGALVGADVLPWRPGRGVYVIIERPDDPDVAADGTGLDGLVEVDGVSGVWHLRGCSDRHPRLDRTDDLRITICYLDDDPVAVAGPIGERLSEHWSNGSIEALLGAPFELVVPWEWNRHLPAGPTGTGPSAPITAEGAT